MSKSADRTIITRREALFLSATAGISVAASKSALASDSIKTAAHQAAVRRRTIRLRARTNVSASC
jgi:hypothetical protein